MLTCAFLIDDDRVQTLVHFGYPIDYVKYTILENESNYCCTAYYLLGTDQNYWVDSRNLRRLAEYEQNLIADTKHIW